MSGIERKKSGYLDNHGCRQSPSKAIKGESCDGCALLEKILCFKSMSMEIEEHDRKKEGVK